jgi:hypothetical protein
MQTTHALSRARPRTRSHVLSAYVTSAIRTGVPVAVGWVVSWLVAKGIGVSPETRDWFVAFLTFACTMAYYLIVRFLEDKFPKAGWLLGVPTKPEYPTAPGATSPVVDPPKDAPGAAGT